MPSDPRASRLIKVIRGNVRWIPFVFIVGTIAYAYLTITISLGVSYHLIRKGSFRTFVSELVISTALAGGAISSFVIAVLKHPGSPTSRHPEAWSYELEQGQDSAQAPLLSQAPIPGQPLYPARSGRQQLIDLTRLGNTSRSVEGRSNIWVKSSGEARWCNKCNAPKPDRCHHCSSCQRCVLRMDHHCPWLANRCIGLRNHKAFFLFLLYTSLFCLYACQETARALLIYVDQEQNGFESSPISWAVVLFLGFIFGATLFPFACYHAFLICKNRTTIESMEGSGRVRVRVQPSPERTRVQDRLRSIATPNIADRSSQRGGNGWRPDEHLSREERRALKKASKLNVYDVGTLSNWTQIMGPTWYLWFVPIGEPELDGLTYLVSTPTLKKLETITATIRVQRSNTPTSRQHDTRSRYPDQHRPSDEDDDSIYGRTSEDELPRDREEEERDTGLYRQSGQQFSGAHGRMEWGDAPRRSPVTYDVSP